MNARRAVFQQLHRCLVGADTCRAEGFIAQKDPRGNAVYWIGPAGREQDSGPGTDFHAVRTGFISITPIQVDLTRYQALEQVASWVGGLAETLGRTP